MPRPHRGPAPRRHRLASRSASRVVRSRSAPVRQHRAHLARPPTSPTGTNDPRAAGSPAQGQATGSKNARYAAIGALTLSGERPDLRRGYVGRMVHAYWGGDAPMRTTWTRPSAAILIRPIILIAIALTGSGCA